MTAPFDPSGKGDADKRTEELTGVDRLFGRDLSSQGWFIDPPRGDTAGAKNGGDSKRRDQPLDPAMIWALRWRRR